MKYLDYREKLGIGFNDKKKFEALSNNLVALFDGLQEYVYRELGYAPSFKRYYLMVGELPINSSYSDIGSVSYSIRMGKTIFDVISKCVAFINSLDRSYETTFSETIKAGLLERLDCLKIQYSLITDEDGIFIFPKGVPEFDDALVSASLDWLKGYPRTEKAWSKALRAYSEVTPQNANDVADLFRKSLETFFQEFFNTGDGRTLENCKSDYGKYLNDNGVPKEVSNNLETLLKAYSNYMNNYGKHTDKAKLNVQEYLMYQTGNIIRLVIMLKEGETE